MGIGNGIVMHSQKCFNAARSVGSQFGARRYFIIFNAALPPSFRRRLYRFKEMGQVVRLPTEQRTKGMIDPSLMIHQVVEHAILASDRFNQKGHTPYRWLPGILLPVHSAS